VALSEKELSKKLKSGLIKGFSVSAGKSVRPKGEKAANRRKSKYNNQPVIIDGMRFDSKKEGNRWNELKLMQKAGSIGYLERQVNFLLIEAKGKEIVCFKRGVAMPVRTKNNNSSIRGLKITMQIDLHKDEEMQWVSNIYVEGGNYGSDQIDAKYGIMINPTEEEVEKAIKIRISESKFSISELSVVPVKYLAADQIESIRNLKISKIDQEKTALELQIEKANNRINELKEKEANI